MNYNPFIMSSQKKRTKRGLPCRPHRHHLHHLQQCTAALRHCKNQNVFSGFHWTLSFNVRSLTVAALSAVGGRIRLADGAALAVGDVHLLAVAQVLTLDLVAENLAVVAHANAAWLWFPDVPVGVHLAVRRAAQLVTWGTRETEDGC